MEKASKKYKDTDATLPSSTVQNETVTNSNGETVHATQSSTQSANQNSNSNGKDSKTTIQKANKSDKNTVAKKDKSSKKEKTTKKNSAQKATKKDEKADEISSQATEQSTTEKPKSREVFLFVDCKNSVGRIKVNLNIAHYAGSTCFDGDILALLNNVDKLVKLAFDCCFKR